MKTLFKIDKKYYTRNIEKALVITLLFLIVIFQTMPKIFNHKPAVLGPVKIDIIIQDVPITEQRVRRGIPRPVRPTIPVPSEDPALPEDVTIDETEVVWDLGDHPDGNSGLTTGVADTIPPRPVVQTLPQIPKEMKKQEFKGIVVLNVLVNKAGKVKDVRVVNNSTGSKSCELAAINAAYKNQYKPATLGKKTIPMWVRCEYRFEN